MSAELSVHISKENALIAATSGALIGSGIVFPPMVGLGVAVGIFGSRREGKHQSSVRIEKLKEFYKAELEEFKRDIRDIVENPYSNPDKFRMKAFKNIPGVVYFRRKMDNDDPRN